MIIGLLKEEKNNEYRVGLTPKMVEVLIEKKHEVFVENNAGIGSGFSNNDYTAVGAKIFGINSATIPPPPWRMFDIIVKVKEPQISEIVSAPQAIFFAFFHLPANPHLKDLIKEKNVKIIPYENIQLKNGSRPILAAMSKVAAEVSVDACAHYLRKENGGKGILLKDSTAMVIGCEGVVGKTAFDILAKRGANVIGFDRKERISIPYTVHFKRVIAKKISSKEKIAELLPKTDLIICAAAARGEGAPKIITREMLKLMQPGSVIADTAIDEGGCCETSRPTSHDKPIYTEEGIIHYCVANIPGVVPRSSTPALTKEIFPYLLEVVKKGWKKALKENPVLKKATKII